MPMQYSVIPTSYFENDLKRLKKRNKNIIGDIKNTLEELEVGIFKGDEVFSYQQGEHIFKVRVINSNNNKGKSSGYRLIYYVIKDDQEVYLLTIYSKSEQSNITQAEIRQIIKKCI